MKQIAQHIIATANPPAEDWATLMATFCDPSIADQDKADMLAALQAVDITGDMLSACAAYLLSQALPLSLDTNALDVCGTGGDKSKNNIKTFNISTAVAFVLAAGGVPVIKHGNRAVSSQSGSSDVLAALKVPVCTSAEQAQATFAQHNLCFVAAPAFHPCLKSLATARKMLGQPTFMNLLGPLCNPARVTKQVMGVFDRKYMEPVAHAAQLLGKTDMMILHSADGLDEISIAAPTHICRLQNGKISSYDITPEDAGMPPASLSALAGGDATQNAGIIYDIFTRPEGPAADIIILNAAAGFITSGKATDLKQGAHLARDALYGGYAMQKLVQMAGAA